MSQLKLSLLFALALLMVPVSVGAVTIIDEESENSIRQNCVDAQQSIQTLQRADAVTRINRGNSYATIQKLMTAMSARAAANAYNIPKLTEATRNFTDEKNNFVTQYTEYEIAVRNLLSMKCDAEPILFYERLQDVREMRADISETIEKLHRYSKDFEEAVIELREDVEEKS